MPNSVPVTWMLYVPPRLHLNNRYAIYRILFSERGRSFVRSGSNVSDVSVGIMLRPRVWRRAASEDRSRSDCFAGSKIKITSKSKSEGKAFLDFSWWLGAELVSSRRDCTTNMPDFIGESTIICLTQLSTF